MSIYELDEKFNEIFDELDTQGMSFYVSDYKDDNMYVKMVWHTPHGIKMTDEFIVFDEKHQPIESWKFAIIDLSRHYDPIQRFRDYARLHNLDVSKATDENKQILSEFYAARHALSHAQVLFGSLTYPKHYA